MELEKNGTYLLLDWKLVSTLANIVSFVANEKRCECVHVPAALLWMPNRKWNLTRRHYGDIMNYMHANQKEKERLSFSLRVCEYTIDYCTLYMEPTSRQQYLLNRQRPKATKSPKRIMYNEHICVYDSIIYVQHRTSLSQSNRIGFARLRNGLISLEVPFISEWCFFLSASLLFLFIHSLSVSYCRIFMWISVYIVHVLYGCEEWLVYTLLYKEHNFPFSFFHFHARLNSHTNKQQTNML